MPNTFETQRLRRQPSFRGALPQPEQRRDAAGATGDYHTDLQSKARTALATFAKTQPHYGLGFIHVKAVDVRPRLLTPPCAAPAAVDTELCICCAFPCSAGCEARDVHNSCP